ncbi:hypothetical protein ACTFIW_007835 [Dictyostelium discoideum]
MKQILKLLLIFLIFWINNFCLSSYVFLDYTNPSTLNTYPPTSNDDGCKYFIKILVSGDFPPDTLDYNGNNIIYPNIVLVSNNETASLFSVSFISGYGNYSISLGVIPWGEISYNYSCLEIDKSKIKVETNKLYFSEYTNFASFFKLDGLIYPLELSYDQNLYSISSLGNYYYLVKFKTIAYINSQTNPWRVDILFPGSTVLSIYFNGYNESIPKIDSQEIVDIELRPTNELFSEMGFQHGPLTTFKSTSTALQTQLFFWDMQGSLHLMAKPLYGTPGNLIYTVLTFPSIQKNNYSLSYPNNNNIFTKGFVNSLSTNVAYGGSINDGAATLHHYYDNSSLLNIYSGGYFGLKNYGSKYFYYSFQQRSSEDIGVSLPFPFGFVWGNNSYYHMNVSKLSSLYLADDFTLIFQDPISGQQIKLGNIPPVNIVTNYAFPEIINFQTFDIGKFKFIVRINIKSQWGVNFFSIDPIEQNKIIINHGHLISGTIYDGIWEFTLNGLIEQYNKITLVTLCDSYHIFYFGDLFSVNNPSETINLPKTKLKNFNYIKDLKNISFLYNNISATNQTISNIMFLNFTNIDDYKDQIIGLNLIDSKSLRDIAYDNYFGAGGSLNDAQLKQYYFAEFDSVNNQFQIHFNIPANTIPGRLDFVLSFSNKVHIYSPSLPNNYQLFVYPLNIDIQGPVFTNIIKNPNGNVGWLVTIEDSINGLDYGVISVYGLIDSSTYNFTIKPSNAVKGNKWKGDYEIYLSNSLCITQDYIIKFVQLFDTQGNSATFIKFMDLSSTGPIFLGTISNPFIYFYNDTNINKISITCKFEIFGSNSIPPQLLSFSSSTSQLDVGLINKVDFDFDSFDDFGIKENQFPIVYLSTRNYETIQCISRNTSRFDKSTRFTCSIEIPIGFGYPNGILLSVYGFINNVGYYSGFCSQQLLEMNFSNFISTNGTFTLDQPYIKSSNKISNLGGNLWIFGRGFGVNCTVWVKYIDDNGFNQCVTTKIYSSSILIERIKPTNHTFTIVIKTPSTMSNEFIINPIGFYYNYTAPTSPPLPTNPPKKCLGNPECGGRNNGYCNNGIGCICYAPWVGEDCTSKVIVIPQPSTNTTNPTTEIPINGGGGSNNTKDNNLYRSLISLVSLRELDFNNKQVKSFNFEKWVYSEINNTTNKYLTTISNKNTVGEIVETNITVVLQWFEKNDTVVFAGQTLRMNPSSIKYTVTITSYSFAQNLNHLQLIMSASLQSSKTDDICSSKLFGNTSDGDNSNFMKLKVNDHSVYGRFIKRAIVDNKIISVDNSILDDSINPDSNSHKSETFIGISIPFYSDSVLVDPDFSLLIDNSPASSNDENSICASSSSKLSKVQIAGIIIGSVGFAAVIIISTIYIIRKRKEQQTIINKLKRVSQPVN